MVVIYFFVQAIVKNVVQAKEHLVDMRQLYHSTISSLAMAIDAKDQTTHGMCDACRVLRLGLQEMAGISSMTRSRLRAASLLHDVESLPFPSIS